MEHKITINLTRICFFSQSVMLKSLSIFQSKSRSTKSGSSLCLRAAGVSSSEVDLAPEPAEITRSDPEWLPGYFLTLPLLSRVGG